MSGSIRERIGARHEAQAATTDYNSWIANQLLVGGQSLGECTVDQQARDPDLDGSPARVALSKEL